MLHQHCIGLHTVQHEGLVCRKCRYNTLVQRIHSSTTIIRCKITPGAELLEIRHQASHSQILEAPPTLFTYLSIHPIGACITNIPACISQNHPLSHIELDNIRL